MEKTLEFYLKEKGFVPTERRDGKKLIVEKKGKFKYTLYEPILSAYDLDGNRSWSGENTGKGLGYYFYVKNLKPHLLRCGNS